MISNISRDLSSNYTCTVANIMKPTHGNEVRGESSKSLYIDVLCKFYSIMIMIYIFICKDVVIVMWFRNTSDSRDVNKWKRLRNQF
jgi:hypothetical protein